MDKFPEAFDRFESDVDVDRFQSYMELSTAFRWWAGSKWLGTSRQWTALNVEAERLGFPVPDFIRREVREARGSGSYASSERQNARFSKIQHLFRMAEKDRTDNGVPKAGRELR